MEMRHIETFLAVSEELSFTRAARRLHLSQPPLSLRIKELESELQVTLFERSTRSVALTPAGKVFLDKLNEAMKMLAGAVEASRQVERGIVGKLRIGYTGLATDLVLPRLIREFRDRHPAIGLDMLGPSPTGMMELALLNKEIDVALCFLPMRHAELESRTLITIELAVALPDRHPLAELTRVPVERLADEAFIAFPANEGFHLREATDAECFRAGFRARVVKESTASQTLLCHVAAGNGVAIMPFETQTRGIEGVTFRPLSPKEAPLRFGMAWRQIDQSAALRQFLAVASDVFHEDERR
ncbi:LysR substrate-binding domain-containing protein [Pseudomonas sp. VI4.1]|uniref:LysR substrate-binding domain-containing protein n=1 Tax=Pseudomonas sp. VI4.1 TaxID=1941346 RepID=UPI0009D5A7C1|nr:LysR substrate-binding domain-containing protein [Pseudomonas sp. VI4.1]OPK10306.1 hypothetical protein BZ163_10785 [Pseudomonas sp. VI4.1]